MPPLARLRHAALHEAAHQHVAALLGVVGRIEISVSMNDVSGSFRIAHGQALNQAMRERIAIAGGVANVLQEEPAITVPPLARRLERLSGCVSSSDAELCGGRVTAAALDDVLYLLRRDWDQVVQLASRECSAFGVSFP